MRRVVLLLLWLALAVPAGAHAAASSQAAGSEAAIAQAAAALHSAGAGLNGGNLADTEIENRLARIRPIQASLAQVLSGLAPRLQDLQAREAQLGQPPAKGAAAIDPGTTAIRRDLDQRLASVTAQEQQAKDLALRADQLSATLSDRLRENFAARLWMRTRSILDAGLWVDFAAALPGDLVRIARAATDERVLTASADRIAWSVVIAGIALAISGFLVGPGRVILNRLGYRRAARVGGEARLRRIVLALWLVFVAAAMPLLAGLLIRAALARIGAMTPDVDQLTRLLVRVTVFAALLGGLGRGLLSPGRPEWRLAPVPEEIVRRLAPFPGLIGVTAALSTFVAGLNTILGASLASRVASDCLSVLIEAAVVGGALAAVGRARVARRALSGGEFTAAERESRLPWILATMAAWVALAAALVSVLVGYLALASFIMRETVWIGAILALLFLLLRLADELFPSLMSPKAPLGGALETALGLADGAMEQIGVLLSGLTRLLLLFLAWIAMLAPFGAGATDITPHFTTAAFVVRLGSVPVSATAILGGVVLFLALLAFTRAIRRWLETRYLPKTGLDVGVRTSLAAGVTYVGALIAVLAAFAYLGLSIAQIALFASALSVGIGFGLQAIIGNFVSGLILLAERPVRVGDWIAMGDLEGDVRKISIRATEIEMTDHSRLIVPNSDLVSKTVRNITHSGAMGRVKIVLKVDGAADPAQVRDILLARLKAHPKVLKDPAAAVYLTDVRDAALEFTAFAYLISPRQAYGVKSELLFQIVPDLKAAGVAFASPATVVNVGLGDRTIEPGGSEPTPAA